MKGDDSKVVDFSQIKNGDEIRPGEFYVDNRTARRILGNENARYAPGPAEGMVMHTIQRGEGNRVIYRGRIANHVRGDSYKISLGHQTGFESTYPRKEEETMASIQIPKEERKQVEERIRKRIAEFEQKKSQ